MRLSASPQSSMWGVQGMAGLKLSTAAMRDVMTEISLSAAYDSIVLGELPHMTRREAENLLAEHAMLGRLQPFQSSPADSQAMLLSHKSQSRACCTIPCTTSACMDSIPGNMIAFCSRAWPGIPIMHIEAVFEHARQRSRAK